MSIKIVADSSANLAELEGVSFSSVPLTITAAGQYYIDTPSLDVPGMMSDLAACKGPTGTACPGPGQWMDAFEGAEDIIVITLTSKLSGCFASARSAADIYRQENPGSRIFLLDTLSTGPEMELIAEKAAELVRSGLPYAEVCNELRRYHERTHLGFILESLQNFARNGRVNPALAKAVQLLGIRIVGRASAVGDLEPVHKCKGRPLAVHHLWAMMQEQGYAGGRVRMRHTGNEEAAEKLSAKIREKYPEAETKISENRGLCSYYAEQGCLLVGYETE